MYRYVVCLIVLCNLCNADDPIEKYQKTSIEGFEILIHPEVEKYQQDAKQMRKELTKQLQDLSKVVPAKALKELKKVRIWVEWEKKKGGAAEFHPSADWLKANGYNPDKAGNVEISNVKNFVNWSRSNQPWMVLHELAHAYHFRVLTDRHPGVLSAYQTAMDRKLYDSVLYSDGKKKKAYACTNDKEYFAELSEAYFGKNDFYPFNRTELKSHDPKGFQLMVDTWQK